jgi:hypothetical protein
VPSLPRTTIFGLIDIEDAGSMILQNDEYYTPTDSVASQKMWYQAALLKEPQILQG